MEILHFLLLGLAICPISSMPQPKVIEGNYSRKDINDINLGLNLLEGDIMKHGSGLQRSAVLGDQYRWNKYVPYVLNNSLSMNDKGVILRAFEHLRLLGCIDFKPWTTENNSVSVESLTGCWSYIGKIGGQQKISIGNGCAYLGIVEHEFLHCLGLFHEQSRYDRDDYVTIVYENIISDYSHNFDKATEQESTLQGIPYDYTSVMHYGQIDFSSGIGRTIITKVPQFQNVIGQRYGLSSADTLAISKLYKCNAPVSFVDNCSFKNSTCQMSTCSSAANGWKMTSNVTGGPLSDHSSLEALGAPVVSMTSNASSGPSSFMYFSTASGKEGDSGRLESREMTPLRDCHVQCLQFFYYHTGNETDQLNIWIREYQNGTDTIGTLRIMDQITGPPTGHWQLHHVPLNAEKPFLVEFEGRKGAGTSSGGFSVDDINLLESECPHNTWQIKNFMELLNKSAPGTYQYSPMYYSPEGYRYQVFLHLNLNYVTVYMRLVSGVNDDKLQWPCPWRQVTFMLLDQEPNIQQRMSYQDSITTDPTEMSGSQYLWDKPSKVGTKIVTDANETVYVTTGMGFNNALVIDRFNDREFVKGGDLIFLFSMQDISALQQKNSLPCPSVTIRNISASYYQGAQAGPCTPRASPTVATTTGTAQTTLSGCCSSAYIVYPSVALLLVLAILGVN